MHARRSWKIEKRHNEREENWHMYRRAFNYYHAYMKICDSKSDLQLSRSSKLKLATHDSVNTRKVSRFEMLSFSEAEPKIFSRYLAIPLFFVFHPRLRRRRRRIYGFCWQWWEENSWQLARTRCHSTIHSKNFFLFYPLDSRNASGKDYMVFLLLCSISLFFLSLLLLHFSLSLSFFLTLERSPRGIKRGWDIFLF